MVKIKKKIQHTKEEREQKAHEAEMKKAGLQDEFQAKGFEFASWIQNHKERVTAVLGGLVVLGALYSVYLIWDNGQVEKASEAYVQALSEANPGDQTSNQTALKKMRTVAEEFRGTSVAGLATLYAAHLAAQDNDPAAAIDLYQQFDSKVRSSNPLKTLGSIGLAGAYIKAGQKEKALSLYEALQGRELGAFEDTILWEISRLSFDLNKRDVAKARALELKDNFPTSPFVNQAEFLLRQMQG